MSNGKKQLASRPRPTLRKCHDLFDLGNRLARVQPLRARTGAIENGMATIEAHAIVKRRFPLLLVLIAGIRQPAVGLQEHGRAEVFFAVPPIRGTGC